MMFQPNRRDFVQSLSSGLGSVALAQMLLQPSIAAAASGGELLEGVVDTPAAPPVRAKHNIVLFMPGGPSQIDMFDPKPALKKYEG